MHVRKRAIFVYGNALFPLTLSFYVIELSKDLTYIKLSGRKFWTSSYLSKQARRINVNSVDNLIDHSLGMDVTVHFSRATAFHRFDTSIKYPFCPKNNILREAVLICLSRQTLTQFTKRRSIKYFL